MYHEKFRIGLRLVYCRNYGDENVTYNDGFKNLTLFETLQKTEAIVWKSEIKKT